MKKNSKLKEELKEVESKYNKVKKITLVFIILLLLTLLIIITYRFIIIKKVVDNNINVDLGDNYKIISTYEDSSSSILYCKNNILKRDNKKSSTILYQDSSLENDYIFIEMVDDTDGSIKKMYKKIDKIVESLNPRTLITEFGIGKDEKIKNTSILYAVLFDNIDINKVNYNGNNCFKITNNYLEIIVNGKNFQIVNDNGVDVKIEKGTVTDEDIKIPNIDEYVLIEDEK